MMNEKDHELLDQIY